MADRVEERGLPLDASRREVPHLLHRESAGSTNTELVQLAGDSDLAPFTTLITTNQTAGRGRLSRVWTAPAGSALAVSVLVKAETASDRPIGPQALGGLPLAASVRNYYSRALHALGVEPDVPPALPEPVREALLAP